VPGKPIDMLRPDLEAAGIDYVGDAGRYCDFHSLRHTTGSLLAASVVHPKVAQKIMRHGDINLTMSLYTHTLRGQEADAVNSLPDFSRSSSQSQKMTGMDDANITGNVLASCLAILCAGQRPTMPSGEKQTRFTMPQTAFLNAPGRTRTCNLRIRSPRLYPIELRAQKSISACNIITFYAVCQHFRVAIWLK